MSNIIATELDYVIQEGNNLSRLIESINIVNESGIILEADDEKVPSFGKLIIERIVNFLTKLKNAIASFFTTLKQKIRSAIGPSKNVVIDDLDVSDVKGYIEQWNSLDDKYKLADDIKSKLKGWELDYDEAEKLFNTAEQAKSEADILLKKIQDGGTVTISGKKASDILNELDGLNIKKALNSINNTIANCHSLLIGSDMTRKQQGLTGIFSADTRRMVESYFREVINYYTISSNIWKTIQQETIKVYSAVTKYVKENVKNNNNTEN